MRLTAELIQSSLSYLNPLKERELDLRGASRWKEHDTTLWGEQRWYRICGTTGHKIPAIENLGVAGVSDTPPRWHYLHFRTDSANLETSEQPHDAIDFTDNDIQILGNFPLSQRLRTLLLARNRISGIQPTLANSIPNLTTLVLTSNNFVELADLDTLGNFRNLTHLILLDNPVARKEVCYSAAQRLFYSELTGFYNEPVLICIF